MSWVDVNDSTGIVTVDYGQAGRDIASAPGKAVDAVVEPIQNAGNAVAQPVRDFVKKGETEGYGEAIWQDVVQPMSDIPGAARGSIVGGAAAIGKELLDPTPGMNPMNIAGGALGGAAIGVAAPYAVDAIQAMSAPNSILRGETWSKAGEGAKIALMGDEQGNLEWSNIPGNVADGISNIYQGGLAGVDQLGADVTGFFGFDEMSKEYQTLADGRRAEMEPNSAVGAVAKELAYDAGMGGVLGKGVDAVQAVGKGVNRFAKSGLLEKGMKYTDELLGGFNDAKNRVKTRAAKEIKAVEKLGLKANGLAGDSAIKNITNIANTKAGSINKKATDAIDALKHGEPDKWFGVQALSDFAGTFSPKSKDFINKNWDNIASYMFGGKKSSARMYNRMLDDLTNTQGYAPAQARKMIQDVIDRVGSNNSVVGALKDGITKAPGSAKVKLFGAGTGITADVDDR